MSLATLTAKVHDRWWWPFSQATWCDTFLDGSDHMHACDHEDHTGYQHTCSCGFRWAS